MGEHETDAQKISTILGFPDVPFIHRSLKRLEHVERHKRIQLVMEGFFGEMDSHSDPARLLEDSLHVKNIFPHMEIVEIEKMLLEIAGEDNRVRLVVRKLLNKSITKTSSDATTCTVNFIDQTPKTGVDDKSKRTRRKRRRRHSGAKTPFSKLFFELRAKERCLQNLCPIDKILYNRMVKVKKMALKDVEVGRHLYLAGKLVETKLFKQVMMPRHKQVRVALTPLSFLKMW